MNVRADIEIHPAANIFPLMDEEAFKALKADIDVNGQREPVVFCDGKLIDGRNRLRACQELGIDPSDCELEADADPVAYVLSANLHRRQLKTSQRAICAAKLAGLPHGGDRKSENIKTQNCGLMSIDDAAKLFSVSPRSVTTALEVLRKASESVSKLCEQGELSVSKAAEFVEAVPDKRKQTAIAKGGRKAIINDLESEDDVEPVCVDEVDETEEDPTKSIVEESPDDKLLRTTEEAFREQFAGRLSIAAARLETLAEKLRSDI